MKNIEQPLDPIEYKFWLPPEGMTLTTGPDNEEIEILKNRKEENFISPELISLEKELALLAESPKLDALKNRSNDLAFSEDSLALQKEQKLLESIELQPDTVKAMMIDRPAYTDKLPLKPKSDLVLVLALISGLLLGIFSAFFGHFIAAAKET